MIRRDLEREVVPCGLSFEDDSLTEQEHMPSCDVNLMVRDASRGMMVRGQPIAGYGYDDMNMSQLDVRMAKERLQSDLEKIASEQEFSEEEFAAIPQNVKEKVSFRVRKKQTQGQNDDKTTIKAQGDVSNVPPSDTTPEQK